MNEGDQSQRLMETQEYDTKIESLVAEIENLAEKYHLEELGEKLKSAREALAGEKGDVEELGRKQHKLEGELELLEGKLKREEEKLFSGTIMNPKGLADLQREVVNLRKKRDEQETEFLERLEEIEGLEDRLKRVEKEESEVLAEEETAREKHYEEKAELEKQIAELEKSRDKIKGSMDPAVVVLYEELLAEKGGLAVVKIERTVCGGCQMELSSVDMDNIRHGEGLFRCRYCYRLMIK